MAVDLDLLAGLSLDAFLLGRFAPPGEAPPDGKAWEGAVSQLLWRPGLDRRQHAGTLGLFGRGSSSGAEHELDGIGSGSGSGVWIEAKARKVLMKHDVASFKIKCEDLYIAEARADARGTTSETWWPLLVSSEIVPTPVRRLCCATGIVLCEPRHLPLPVLLRAAGRPIADDYLRDDLMGELVRLGEPACQPMQGWWRIDPGERKIWRSLDGLDAEDIGDLLYLQGELSDDLLDALERDAPELLDRRAAALLDRLSGRVLSM